MLLLGLYVGHRARSLVIPEREQAEVPPPPHTLEGHLLHTGSDYTQPAVHLAAHLGHVIRQLTGAPQQVDQPVDLEELRETLRALIHQGRISGRAGGRIEQLLTYLQTLTEVDAVPVDAERFTALAGEIEWAEQVLVHTLGPKSGDDT